MMFVTVGTHTQNFNRLLEEIDRLVDNKVIKERVIAQIGHSNYEPKNIEWFRFTNFEKLNKLYKSAKLFVTHGGAGSILNGLSNGKPVIAVPRLKKYGEHVNNHQLDLVKSLEKKEKIVAVYNIKNLSDAISSAKKIGKIRTKNKICSEIENFLERL